MVVAHESSGALKGVNPSGGVSAMIDNRTGLPDGAVREAIMAQWLDATAALQLQTPSTFQLYATSGSGMLNRSPFNTPSNVIDEIKLSRQMVDTDDDIRSALGAAISTAFADEMQNQHADERTLALFDRIAGPRANNGMDLMRVFKELYREYLIAGQVNTISLFSRSRFNFTPMGTETTVQAQLSTPLVGIIPAENIRVISNDLFGTGELAYDVTDAKLSEWLGEYFGETTSPARRHELAQEQPVLAAMFTRKVEVDWNDTDLFSAGKVLYALNPRMVHRTTMPKGASAYPRPPLTANFALLEAKRLLNIMDYALLQGGTNYIVVAKVGTDKLPAQQPEVDNLTDQVRNAGRTGVLVGDHRLSLEIITPSLTELLNKEKRQLVGRKLTMALLRIPEQVTHDPGQAGAAQELQFISNGVTSDRNDLVKHVEGYIYTEIVSRNPSTFKQDAPNIWFAKIVLSGVKDFFTAILQARDRGDIPRKYAVEALGFDYESGVAQRKRELANGDDDVMVPGNVPFDSPGGPSSPPLEGRPPGSSSDNGSPNSGPSVPPEQRQRQLTRRRRGEPVQAQWDAELERTVRVGELTRAILEEYPEAVQGRVSGAERAAIEERRIEQSGPLAVIPVNVDDEVRELRAFTLSEGLRLIVGQRIDGALLARALSFREPQFDLSAVEDMVLRWGFETARSVAESLVPVEQAAPPEPAAVGVSFGEVVAQAMQNPEVMLKVQETLVAVAAAMQPNVTVNVPENVPPQIEPPEPE